MQTVQIGINKPCKLIKIYQYIQNFYNNTLVFPYKIESNTIFSIDSHFNKELIDLKNDILYINLTESTNLYQPNFLNLKIYFDILGCDINTLYDNEDNVNLISYAIYNFILINTGMKSEYPRVLDPISSIIEIVNNKKSFVRFGDGELRLMSKGGRFSDWNYASLLKNKELYSNILTELLKNNNCNIMIGICDTFDEKYADIWTDKYRSFWYGGLYAKRFLNTKCISMTNVYGSSFIGRLNQYKIFNSHKYSNYFNKLLLNKINIIICNKEVITSRINAGYFVSHSNIFVICKKETCKNNEKIVAINNENSVDSIILKTRSLCKKYNGNCFLHFGFYSKRICYELSQQDIKCVDLGRWGGIVPKYDKNEIYLINNIISILNYKINVTNINYKITTSNPDIISEFDPLILNLNKSTQENQTTIFKLSFPINTLEYKNFKVNIHIDSSEELVIFNGKQLINIKGGNKDNIIDIINYNTCYITLSNFNFIDKELIINSISLKILYIE
jgi:hypothetical protein